MNAQLFIFLFMIIIGINCDVPSLRSAYFEILREQHFEQANLCLPSVGTLTVINLYECQIACLENKLCRTATFYQSKNQCNLFFERLKDGRITPMHSAIVISLIKRHSSPEMTNEYLLTQITSPTDHIAGIWDTHAGEDSPSIQLVPHSHYEEEEEEKSPPDQDASKAIDNDISTKYVSFGDGCSGCHSITGGHNTGFYIIPTRLSILTHLCWGTSSEIDETGRDPMIITIEGSNITSTTDLTHGSSWSLIYNGTSGLDGNPPRSTYKLIELNPLFRIKPSPFRSYRLLVVQKRGLEDSVQYSEVQLFGHIID